MATGAIQFQSSPGPKAGRSRVRRRRAVLRHVVSILARPEGRALRGYAVGAIVAPAGFNPRPARRPGAPLPAVRTPHVVAHVSILARPEGRALPGSASRASGTARRFNPRPARRPGAPPLVRLGSSPNTSSFQSSPGPKAGRSDPTEITPALAFLVVSILARPEGRALRRPGQRHRHRCRCFNPRPARRPGAPVRERWARGRHGLVSILARPEGRALRRPGQRHRHRCRCFNPRPARRPGAPVRERWARGRHGLVSILARPEGRALRRPGQRHRHRCRCPPRSILARPEGRALLFANGGHEVVMVSFQSSPGPKAGRSRSGIDAVSVRHHVSILARPEGRALLPTTLRSPS